MNEDISESPVKFNKTGKPKKPVAARSLANLKPYKPGETGNAAGSPIISIQNKLRAAVARCITAQDVDDIVTKWKNDSKSEVYEIRAEARRDLIGSIIGKPKTEVEVAINAISPEEMLKKIDEALGLNE